MNPIEQAGAAQAVPTDVLTMLGGVLRRWKLLTVIPIFTLMATYGALKVLPSLYKSSAEILIFDPQRQMDDAVQKRVSPFVDAVDNVAMNTEIEVIKSKSVALRVANELRLDKDAEFRPRSGLSALAERLGISQLDVPEAGPETALDRGEMSAERLDRAADALLAKLQVERLLFSYILAISVTSEDPVKAQRL